MIFFKGHVNWTAQFVFCRNRSHIQISCF